MKKQQMTKEELRRIEYEFAENKQMIPSEVAVLLEKSFDLIRPYIEVEKPLGEELKVVLRKLIQQEFLWINTKSKSWWHRWMDEIADQVAISLSSQLTLLAFDADGGKSRRDLYDDFENIYAFYTQPHNARLREVPDWTGEEFWDALSEDKQKELLEEIKQDNEQEYQDEKQACDGYNAMKDEFLKRVQPVVFKHIGVNTESFDSLMWQHYGIALGSAFYDYEENCSDLGYMYNEDELTEDPGSDFHTYKQQFNEKYFPSIYKPTGQQTN